MKPWEHLSLLIIAWLCGLVGYYPALGRPRGLLDEGDTEVHVHSTGNDWGEGTEEQPLRTLREVSARLPMIVTSDHVIRMVPEAKP